MRLRFAVRRVVPVVLLLTAAAAPAPAVIRVDVPLAQVYKTAQNIIIAKVGAVDAAKKQANLREAVTMDELGKKVLLPRDRTLTLDLAGDASLAGRLRPGDAVVVFVGQRAGAVHAADAWFQASPGGGADWRILKAYAMAPADMYGDGSFEMLILEEDGTLWQKDSPVYVRGKPIGEWEEP